MASARRPETVTVVFTDVVGSTAWRASVGDDVADVRIAELERASRHVVEASGGTVVKSVGDGVMATFGSAVAGLEAAAELQLLARRLPIGSAEQYLRVGVSTGDMVREGDDWLGAAAIEASRLCSAATGGSVLVTDATVRLSRGRTDCAVRSLGERILRGFEQPVEVYELVTVDDGGGPLPAALVSAASSPLVGRRVELERAASMLNRVTGGTSLTVLIVGEPGVGKTRLAAAMAADARSRGFTVLHGRCDEGLAAPYQPVVEAYGAWLAEYPDAALPRVIGDGAELVSLWPALARRLGIEPPTTPDDPEARRWRLFEAVAALMASIAAERPLLLVVDDLQWAEPSTLLLLGHLVRRAVPGSALVATLRRGQPGRGAVDVLGDPGTDRSVELIDLGGLDRAEVGELLALHSGVAPPDAVSAVFRQYTDGNPFFLAALLAHLEDVAFVRSPSGDWVAAAELEVVGVPEGARGVIARRLAGLESGTRRVLDACAVTGLRFDPRIVAAAIHVDFDEALDAVDTAVRSDLLREEGGRHYVFAHALVRQAVLDDLSRPRLVSLHWRIAEQLEHHEPALLGEIADHYASGREMGDDATVVRTSLAAGEDALQRVAFEEAVGHLRTALAGVNRMSSSDPDLRYRVLAALGGALNALAEPAEAQRLWLAAAEIARDARDPERIFAAVQGYGYVARLTADDELVRLLEDLLDVVGPGDSALRASALGWRAVPVQNVAWQRSRDDMRLTDEAVAMARRTGDRDALISTLHSRLILQTQMPDAHAMLSDAQEVVDTLERAGPTNWDHTFAKCLLTLALLRLGRRSDAEEHLAKVTAEAERIGLRLSGQRALHLQSALATGSGRFSTGKALAAAAAERAGRHILVVHLAYIAQILAARFEQGRLDRGDHHPGRA